MVKRIGTGILTLFSGSFLGTKESTYYTVATGNSDTKVLPANTDTITSAVCKSEILTHWSLSPYKVTGSK